jgi:hypothetical protein
MSRPALFVAASLMAQAAVVQPVAAQDGGTRAALVLAPSYSAWSFGTAVPQDSLLVKRAWQITVPVGASVTVGRLTFDASGSMASGRVRLEDGRTLELSGLTDVRFRGVARVIGDQLLLTVGLNAPVGATRLAGYEIDALGVLGSPALGFAAPTLGSGFGATAGVVYAMRAGSWAVAVGSSFERRSQYTPIEAQIAGVSSATELKPGNVVRLSVGLDRIVGQGRLSFLLAGDWFGESRIEVPAPGGPPVDSRYKLGPQFSANVIWETGARGFRSLTVLLADRYRTRYTGFDGAKTPHSDGNVLEAAVEAVRGAPGKAGLYLRADGRLDSGLDVDDSITTAAMTAGALTLGVAAPLGRASLLPFLRFQAGRLDTGPTSTTALGWGAGVTLTVR